MVNYKKEQALQATTIMWVTLNMVGGKIEEVLVFGLFTGNTLL